jgi:hypothetical protein
MGSGKDKFASAKGTIRNKISEGYGKLKEYSKGRGLDRLFHKPRKVNDWMGKAKGILTKTGEVLEPHANDVVTASKDIYKDRKSRVMGKGVKTYNAGKSAPKNFFGSIKNSVGSLSLSDVADMARGEKDVGDVGNQIFNKAKSESIDPLISSVKEIGNYAKDLKGQVISTGTNIKNIPRNAVRSSLDSVGRSMDSTSLSDLKNNGLESTTRGMFNNAAKSSVFKSVPRKRRSSTRPGSMNRSFRSNSKLDNIRNNGDLAEMNSFGGQSLTSEVASAKGVESSRDTVAAVKPMKKFGKDYNKSMEHANDDIVEAVNNNTVVTTVSSSSNSSNISNVSNGGGGGESMDKLWRSLPFIDGVNI